MTVSRGSLTAARAGDSHALHPQPHPHSGLLFIDWILSEEGQTRLSDAAGRISIRKGIKHKPWVQDLFQKDFVFLSPSLIGPNLNVIIEQYNRTFGVQKTK